MQTERENFNIIKYNILIFNSIIIEIYKLMYLGHTECPMIVWITSFYCAISKIPTLENVDQNLLTKLIKLTKVSSVF